VADAAADAEAARRAAAAREQEAGNAAVARRDWREAQARYTASLALHATAAGFSNRAAARLAQGQAAEAVADARAALALDAGFVRAYVRLSAALRALGDNAAALASAREGLALAERTGSPLAAQLREAAAVAAAVAPRCERKSAAACAMLIQTACAHCGAALEAKEAAKTRCGACRQVSYCNAECQRAGRPAHREACKLGARAIESTTADAGLAALPKGEHMHALQNWIAEHSAHYAALQILAWHVQHSVPHAAWGVTAEEAAGSSAVGLTVLRQRTTDDTLHVSLRP
jgi:tetratricopeptide (TPR) repeat protein